jgi:hypothetical protein
MLGEHLVDAMMLEGRTFQQLIEGAAANIAPKIQEQRCKYHIEQPAKLSHRFPKGRFGRTFNNLSLHREAELTNVA